MAKCDFCGKDVSFGIKVSHSHRRSNRTWKPNVKRVKAIVDGSPKRVHACTRCLRSGKVTRAIWSYELGQSRIFHNGGSFFLAFHNNLLINNALHIKREWTLSALFCFWNIIGQELCPRTLPLFVKSGTKNFVAFCKKLRKNFCTISLRV